MIRRVEIGNSENEVKIPAGDLTSIRVGMDGEARTNGEGGWEQYCQSCGMRLYENGHGQMIDAREHADCASSKDGHLPADVPLTWLNSFGVSLKPEEETIRFHVSVGDPRGAMVMELRKVDGELFLSVPSADESHVTLEPVGDGGVYRIK